MRRLVETALPARMGTPFRWLVGSSWISNLGDGIGLSFSRRPASVANPLLNPERAEAIREWRASGGGAVGYRAFMILGGPVFVVVSALLYLGVIS